MMKSIVAAACYLAVGCTTTSSTTWSYETETWAKKNYPEAHTDCQAKAGLALGRVEQCAPLAQWSCNLNFNKRVDSFMVECMAGQGFVWTEHHIELIADLIPFAEKSNDAGFVKILQEGSRLGYTKIKLWMVNNVVFHEYVK